MAVVRSRGLLPGLQGGTIRRFLGALPSVIPVP